jgi:TolB-like protein
VSHRIVSALAIASWSAGCAPIAHGPDVVPSEIAALEAERAANPRDPERLLQLGAGYYRAGRFGEARDVLGLAASFAPSFAALVYRGLAFEGLGEPDSALVSYRNAAPLARSGSERREVEQRLTTVGRSALAARARAAISRESALARTAPVPNAVAVLPFAYLGADEVLRPLERGIAQLVVTDLGKVRSLVLLEREQVQALADELRLGATARVEAATAARQGRLLRAGRVVQGTLREVTGGATLRLEASAVATTTGRVAGSGTSTDRLQRLFDMEKQVVFQLLERLNVTLSPAERQAISERPTSDLQAFLAFSRGLEAEDRGDFRAARAHFESAAARDAGFAAARDRVVRAASLAAGADAGEALVRVAGASLPLPPAARLARASALRDALQRIAPSLAGRLTRDIELRSPLVKSRLSETLRQDDPTHIGLIGEIVIVVPRP